MSNNIFPIPYRPIDIKSFTYNYLANKLMSKKKVEVELRMGKFNFEDQNKGLKNYHYNLSFQNPLIINSNLKEDKKYFDTICHEFNNLKYNFNPNLEEDEFFRILDLMNKYQKTKELKKSEIIIDFLTSSKKRFSWNFENNEFIENTKSNKENIDFLHQGKQYRLSTAEENFIMIEDVDKILKSNTFQYIRVKFRTHFFYQFLDYSFTKTISINRKDHINTLKTFLDNSFRLNLEYNQKLNNLMSFLNKSDLKSENEVEVEIFDNEYLKNLIMTNIPGYHSCIDRMFRNFEILYLNKEIHTKSQNYLLFCKNEKIEPVLPFIGGYIEDIFNENND